MSDWGQGAVNNNISWGAGASNNINGWGVIHDLSYGHPQTNLVGQEVTPTTPPNKMTITDISLQNTTQPNKMTITNITIQ